MISPDERTLRAIINLQSNSDFEDFVKWLQDSMQLKREEISGHMDVVRLRWAQGQLQALEDLNLNITQARNLLQRRR